MKKVMTFGLAAVAALCFTVSPAFAGDHANCGAKAEGAAATKASATEASTGKHACPMTADGKVDKEACAKMMGMTPEECAALCKDGKMEMVSMNVKGMTCGGCEKTVTTALQKVDGVRKVVSVSYTDGTALVCVDPTKVKPEALTTAVTNSGYQAEVIPAVATTASGDHAKSCSGAMKAGCCAAKAGAAKAEAPKTGAEGTK